MDHLARDFDAMKLAERLQGINKEQLWVHLAAESPLEKYPAKHHARRVRDRLDVAEGLVYLPGAPARNNEDSDMPAPFRQRRYFYYLSGCNEASCHLTYDIKRDILTLFIPRVNPDRVIWNGRGSTLGEALDKYDIDEVFYVDQLGLWLHDWFLNYRFDGSQRLYILHKDQIPNAQFPWPVNATSLQPAMNHCRMVKDDHEIRLIRRANDISSKAHKYIMANITRFNNEAQVEGRFLDVCVSNQAKQQAYDPIAASGPNAGTLHYDANNEDFGDRQLMCLDAGCEFELYASDVTRTFPLSGTWPSKEAENIYKLVEQMQEACIQRLAPGVRYLDLHILAHQIAIDGLLKLGILHNGTREEIYKAGTSKAFFPHGLGHHIGLEVHDVGQRELMSLYKQSKYEKVPSLYPEDFHLPVYDDTLCMAPTLPESPHLEEGMVVTVEPGIYFSAYALEHFYFPSPIHQKYINREVLARYLPVGGVRIEDDILITSKGFENLTKAPKGDAMLAVIRNQGNKSTPAPKDQRSEAKDESLYCAPGITHRAAKQALRPLTRAATEPIENVRATVEENSALENHWLFQEAPKRVEKPSTVIRDDRLPLCGKAATNVEHIFMGWESEATQHVYTGTLRVDPSTKSKPKCRHCAVLSETIDRLRQTLSRSRESSPKLDNGSFQPIKVDQSTVNNLQTPGPFLKHSQSSSEVKAPEMRQIPPTLARTLDSSSQRAPLSYRTGTEKPTSHAYLEDFELPPPGSQPHTSREVRNNRNTNPTHSSQANSQRRSVTFDTQPNYGQQPMTTYGKHSAPDQYYLNTKPTTRHPLDDRPQMTGRENFAAGLRERRSMGMMPTMYTQPANGDSKFACVPPRVSRNQHTSEPPTYCGSPKSFLTPLDPGNLVCQMPLDAVTRGGLAAALERDEQRRQLELRRQGGLLPSRPITEQNLPGDSFGTGNSGKSRYQRQTDIVTAPLIQQQQLRQRHSMGSLLKPAGVAAAPQSRHPSIPIYPSLAADNSRRSQITSWRDSIDGTSVTYPHEHVGRMNRRNNPFVRSTNTASGGIYTMNRPGGEEISGIDYANR